MRASNSGTRPVLTLVHGDPHHGHTLIVECWAGWSYHIQGTTCLTVAWQSLVASNAPPTAVSVAGYQCIAFAILLPYPARTLNPSLLNDVTIPTILLAGLLVVISPWAAAAAPEPPRLAPPGTPQELPSLVFARQVAAVDRERIFHLASQAFALHPPAITDEVATNSPGGVHDYFSQADYAWPNSTNQTGLPYVTRDGESNPHTFTAHRLAMRHLKDAVAALAAAWLLNGDDKYAARAAHLLQVFFLDEATRMNPNLACAQVSLGHPQGTPYGIIDTLHLCEVARAIPFLEKSPAFPPAVDQGVKQWFDDYTQWILASTNGVKEMNGLNNHSIACYLQLACFARLTGNERVLTLARQQFKQVLFPNQMTNDGSFPRELARTKPYGYSIFQADNLATLCTVLSTPSEDFWKFKLPDGRTPRQAIDFIYPYLADKTRWLADGRRQDIQHWESWPVRQPCLILAYAEFGDAKYFKLWQQLEPDPTDLEIRRNLAITQPILWVAWPGQIPLVNRGRLAGENCLTGWPTQGEF